jgi:hypothetical protein
MGERTTTYAGPLREDHDTVAARENRASGGHRLFVTATAIDRKSSKAVEQPGLPATLEQLTLGHVVDRPPRQRADHERIEKATVVGREQYWAGAGDVLASEAGDTKVEQEEGDQDRSHKPVEHRVDAMGERVLAKRVQLARLDA